MRSTGGPCPRLMRSIAMLAIAIVWIASVSAEETIGRRDKFVGRALSSVLDELRARGLPILYSDLVVRSEMKILREPSSSDARSILEEILIGHRLEARELEGGQIVIVPVANLRGDLELTVRLGGEHGSIPVSVAIPSLEREIRSETPGVILIEDLPEGRHDLQVTAAGFVPETMRRVRVTSGDTRHVGVVLEPILHLEEIVVVPAQISLRRQAIGEQHFLSGDEIESSPHIGDDLMRAATASPGISSSDFSARFNPRGGGETETLVLLDGVELYEPFHLKDFSNIFSIIDSKAAGEVDLLTGAFTAEYGDRMSAVMDITVLGAREMENEITVGTLNSRLFSSGRFNNEQGEWLLTARGWYPSALPDVSGFIEAHLIADYYDVLARVRYPIGPRMSAAIGVLGAYDHLSFREADERDLEWINARYKSDQSWLAIDGSFRESIDWRSTLSVTNIDRYRRGEEMDAEEGFLAIGDDRFFESVDVRSDWSWSFEDRQLLKWGGGIRRQKASYDYDRMFEAADEAIEIIAPSVRIDRDGWAYHGYLSDRFRLGSRTVMEVGLRWDHQDWVEDSQISPRANLKFDVGTRTEARIGWGRFHQSQRLNEIPVEDGAIDFHEAEQAEHRVLSVVHRFVNDWTLRGGLYEKRFDHLRPRYENLFSRLELFPESREDRVLVDPERGYARGLELMLRNGMTAQVAWWLGYTLSEANDVIDGVDVPRNWDQRHGLDGGMAFRLPWKLSLGLAGTWHSGRPMTGVTVEWERDEDELEPVIVPASRNGERLGNYGRLDLRIGREFSTRHGSGEVVLQVFNATNRRNVCHIEDFQILNDEDGVRVVPEEQICSSIIPTLDLRWRF